ncbi:MAG: thioredoxin domain-containing protein [Flaviflexus sp.]|nr:thioredoxin domain-containing protein [Flaviflexus sp.]
MGKNYTSSNRIPTTKKERREAAREKARKIQAEEEKRAKRNKMLTIGAIAAVALVVLISVISILTGGKDEEEAAEWDAPEVSVTPVTEDDLVTGYQIVGESKPADDAPRVDLYFDYLCSHCVDLEMRHGADLATYADNGKAQVILHPVAILGQEFSAEATAAFREVAEKDPEHLLAFHKAVFDHAENLMKTRASDAGGWGELVSLAEEAGVSSEVAEGLEANADLEWANKVSEHFLEDYRGTPTLLVNGEQNYEWAEKPMGEILGID